ncbi:uncharacterized protein [Periplaneta americana]|uniref:uncharacterized protein isoform X2 n=1 Tax=Periplaneta americana TaxID=6978 RepID=UPI0037E84DCF
MAATAMLLWSCLLACLAAGHGFFLPSFSSSQPKKSEVAAQWPVMRDTLFYGQHYHGGGALEHAVPVAVPYPVAVPAPPPHPQVALAAPSVSAASSAATLQAAAYHSMQLVPCLCSVPKDDIDNAGSVLVQGNQQLNENK